MIYREQCADFYSKSWNAEEFQGQFNLLMDKEALLGVSENGIIHLGIFEKIGQILKNFIGGTDYSQRERVQAAWLKFLYYGEAHGLLKEDHIEKLGRRISQAQQNQFDPAIKKLFKKVTDYHKNSKDSQSNHLKQLREIVVEYHKNHATLLRPGIWRRFFSSEKLDPTKIIFFGDTPLQLHQKALKQNHPRLALEFLMKAFDVKNDSADFQKQVAEHLQKLEAKKFDELKDEAGTLQELWMKLAHTAFENQLPEEAKSYLSNALRIDNRDLKLRLEVGKLYLSLNENELAKPFLPDLQKAFPQDLSLQLKIGNIYWKDENFDQALAPYEAAIKIYLTPAGKTANQKEMADVYYRAGHIHLKKLIPSASISKAISYLSEAVLIDSSVLKPQEELFDAYKQEWQASQANFFALHEKNWLPFLDKLPEGFIKKEQQQIMDILIECAKLHFQAHQNQNGHAYLKKALSLFEENAGLKIKVLDLAIQYHDLALQIEMGHAYWKGNNLEQAIKAYTAALKVYATSPGKNANHNEMADIYYRAGHVHLKKLIPTGNLTNAVSYLSEAFRINPYVSKHQEELYDAYVQEWQASHGTFFAAYEKNWMPFLKKAQGSFIKKHEKQILEIVIECAQLHFQAHQNQNGHATLNKAIFLFEENADLKIKALEMAIQHGDCSPYQDQWPAWEKEHSAHPYLKEKIGDALWLTNKKAALVVYQESLTLFTQKLTACQDDQMKADYKKHMAYIQSRIGQNLLQKQPSFFKGVEYDKAIESLEKAVALDPETHASQLFDAYMSAVEAEKKKSWALRDTNKIMAHYLKAFQAFPKKGDYLIELLDLYFNHQRFDDATALYHEIQKQPWASYLDLSAALCTNLGKSLSKKKDDLFALKCFKSAYKLEPANQKYKHNYFQSALNYSQSEYQKLLKGQPDMEEGEFIECLGDILQNLEICQEAGFEKVEKLKESFKEQLAMISKALAESYVKSSLLPKPTKQMGIKEMKKHIAVHKKDLVQALNYYDQALEYQPSNAALHFDKAALLDWMCEQLDISDWESEKLVWKTEHEKIISELELAIKYQPLNPFYHKLLARLYFVVSYHESSAEQYELAIDCASASPEFNEDYQTWTDEFLSRLKTKQIDPHAYTQRKKGWF